jgi:hypothetical protein
MALLSTELLLPCRANREPRRASKLTTVISRVVGALGIVLPFVLVFVDRVWLDGDTALRTSLSACPLHRPRGVHRVARRQQLHVRLLKGLEFDRKPGG